MMRKPLTNRVARPSIVPWPRNRVGKRQLAYTFHVFKIIISLWIRKGMDDWVIYLSVFAGVMASAVGCVNMALNTYVIRKFPLILEIKDILYQIGSTFGLKKTFDDRVVFDPPSSANASLFQRGGVDTPKDDVANFHKEDRKYYMDIAHREQAKNKRLQKELDRKAGIADDDEREDLTINTIDWEIIEEAKTRIPELEAIDISGPLAKQEVAKHLNENETMRKVYDGMVAAMSFMPTDKKAKSRKRNLA